MRLGTICAVIANRVHDTHGDNGGEARACRAASEAVRLLVELDRLKAARGAGHFYPGLLTGCNQHG